MILFRDFTLPLWKLFAGNLLLLACSLCYLAWWAASFRQNSSGGAFIAAAFITGIAAMAAMSNGIASLSRDSGGTAVAYILAGALVLFIILLIITSFAFRRPVTSELLILHLWGALELSAAAVLYGSKRLGTARAAVLVALVAAATVAGLVCYVLYYRVDEAARFRIGMVPLIVDSSVAAVFLGMMASS
ncbi:MAG: hypothetical protein JXA20_05795 [Spirochaetes bacterium]|nr:hypothetical protein [Spirochaetota bacterium]